MASIILSLIFMTGATFAYASEKCIPTRLILMCYNDN
jgi:hypothetical protein